MTNNQWKSYFVILYKAVEDKSISNLEVVDGLIRKCDGNKNLKFVVYYLWRVYFYNDMQTIEWWKTLFREILDFVSVAETTNKETLITKGEEICEKYSNNDITNIIYYLIKETKQC